MSYNPKDRPDSHAEIMNEYYQYFPQEEKKEEVVKIYFIKKIVIKFQIIKCYLFRLTMILKKKKLKIFIFII